MYVCVCVYKYQFPGQEGNSQKTAAIPKTVPVICLLIPLLGVYSGKVDREYGNGLIISQLALAAKTCCVTLEVLSLNGQASNCKMG